MYNVRIWYIGLVRGKTTGKKVIRFFYKATYDEKPCFIKLEKYFTQRSEYCSTIREIRAYKQMSKFDLEFIPALLLSDESYEKNTAMIATEFIPDLMNFKIPIDKKEFEVICEQLEHIHGQMREADIVHGDLSVSNLSMTKDQHIVIIDFGIAYSPTFKAFQLDTAHVGTHFKVSENKCIYDNAYSFLRIMDDCGISETFKQEECYKRLQRLVGAHTHVINI